MLHILESPTGQKLLVAILVSAALPLLSQESILTHNLGTNEGLPSPEVHCILKDRQGFLWFGTDNGACRYNGYDFQIYDAVAGLEDNVVLNILEDHMGTIWFGTLSGKCFFYHKNTIMPYRYNAVVESYKDSCPNGQLIRVDSNGTTIFELTGCGILEIDANGNDTLVQAVERPGMLIYMRHGLCRPVETRCLNSADCETLQSADGKILDFLGESDRFQARLSLNPHALAAGQAFNLGARRVLVCNRSMLLLFEGDRLLWKRATPYILLDLVEDNLGGFWAGLSHDQGLRFYRSLDDLQHDRYIQLIQGETITQILSDEGSGLWAASHNSGVFHLPMWKSVIFDEKSGLEEDLVTTIAIKSNDELFLGFANDRIAHFDVPRRAVSTLHKPLSPYNHKLSDLYYDQKNDVLWGHNVYFDKARFLATKLRLGTGMTGFIGKRFHYDHRNGSLWMTNAQGYLQVDAGQKRVISALTDFNVSKRIYSVYMDEDRQVWTGCLDGLFQLQQNGLIRCGVSHPAFQNRIEDIDAFDGRHLVLGTKGRGVIIWKDQKDIIELTTEQGLASNMIEDVHVDENNIAWIATFAGLSKIETDSSFTPRVRTFTMSNGLPSNEIYQVKSHQEQVWLCTAGGLVKWQEPSINPNSPAPIIEELRVNGVATSHRRFSHKDDNVAIQYLTINYRQFGKIPFRYRTSAKDAWTETTDRNVYFAKLSPGAYRFEIQSANEDGVWSDSAIESFTIRSAWYDTWTFRVSATLAFGLLGFILYQRRARVLQERKAFRSEIEDLKQTALKAQMNPHFVFNCLNAIQSLVVEGQDTEANDYLVSFSRLIRGCLDASMQQEVSLEDDITFLRSYLEMEKIRFGARIDYDIHVAAAINPQELRIPPMLVLPFVENAVVHGLVDRHRHGMVKIDYKIDGPYLLIEIKDNGIGYHASLERKRSKAAHKSVGITLTKRRLALHNDKAQDGVAIKELKDDAGTTLGTQVTLRTRILV